MTIQLSPKLQNAVHLFKNLQLNQASPSLAVASSALSSAESSALMNTFTTREKKQKEPICNWF